MKIWNDATKSFDIKPDSLPKIRVWDDVLNEMLYGEWEQMDDGILFRFNKHLETENPIYMLSIQANDKHEVEIHEGDIYRAKIGYCGNPNMPTGEHVGVILYDGRYRYFGSLSMGDVYEIEVLGNIHQNPELLK